MTHFCATIIRSDRDEPDQVYFRANTAQEVRDFLPRMYPDTLVRIKSIKRVRKEST